VAGSIPDEAIEFLSIYQTPATVDPGVPEYQEQKINVCGE
jgi:hypothetical protein